MVARESAEALYVVVRVKDIYDFGKGGSGPQDRFLMVPWSHLDLDTAHQRLVTDVAPAAPIRRRLAARGIEVIVAR